MALDDFQRRAEHVRHLHDRLNLTERGRVRTDEEFMLGFVGDVGDLAELVMAAEGARDVPGARAALEHELADCLWSVLVLAGRYDIDLRHAFHRTMTEREAAINARLSAGRPDEAKESERPSRTSPSPSRPAASGPPAPPAPPACSPG
ncbi:MazG nucleotide pyrophosphohydrolase domain-containing protein [Streptomyces sp. NPDC001781]